MEPGYMRMEDDQEMNIRDMFSWMILRWKMILCFMLAGCILLGLFGYLKAKKASQVDSTITKEQLETLRDSLSEAEALEVENTFSEYQILQNYIEDLGRYTTVFRNTSDTGGKILVLKYYVVSRMKYSNGFYMDMAVSSEDYKKIYKIAFPDTDGKQPDKGKGGLSPLQFFSDRDENTDVYVSEQRQDLLSQDAVLITAFISAQTEDQCEEIRKIVDQAFDKETQILKETDSGIICRCVDAFYSSDQMNYFDSTERVIVEKMYVANNAFVLLKNNIIDKFSDGQESYFNALKSAAVQKDDEEESGTEASSDDSVKGQSGADKSVSKKKVIKYGLVGAFAGCFLALGLLLLLYVFNDRMQTDDELNAYGIRILDSLYFGKDESLIRKIARKVRGITTTPVEVQKQMLAEDISIIMKGADSKKLYFLLTADNPCDMETAEQIKKLMADNNYDISIGDPLKAPKELKCLSETDQVVILAHVKETRRDTIKRVKEICERYDKEISGAIAIEVC